MRDALTILEKCCAYSKNIDNEIVSMVLGRADRGIVSDWIKAFAAKDEKETIILTRRIISNGIEVNMFSLQIIEILNDILLSKVTGEENEWSGYASSFTNEYLISSLDIFNEMQSRLRYVSKNEILLETAVLKALIGSGITGGYTDNSSLNSRLDALELKINRLSASGGAVTRNNVPRRPQDERVSSASKEQKEKKEDKETVSLKSGYYDIIFSILNEDIALRPFLKNIRVVKETEDMLVLEDVSALIKNAIEEKKDIIKSMVESSGSNLKKISYQEAVKEKRSNFDIPIID